MTAILKVLEGKQIGQVFEWENVPEQVLSLGRFENSSFVIDDPLVARRHAQIIMQNNRTFIEDLGTHNGTFLNSQRIVEGSLQEVKSGDLIKIGNTVLEFI